LSFSDSSLKFIVSKALPYSNTFSNKILATNPQGK